MAATLVMALAMLAAGCRAEGWGAWSPWPPCSRPCGEGLQARSRVCLSPLQGCQGSGVAWRACGLMPCPAGGVPWREEQCAAHNNRALEGSYHLWQAVELPESPCSLDCRAEGAEGLVPGAGGLKPGAEGLVPGVDGLVPGAEGLVPGVEGLMPGAEGLVHRFAARAEDGTVCGDAGLSLCLAGQCEPIGCDLELRSLARLDRCGVCGGNGSSCQGSRYVWHQELLSRCSAPCGGGEQMVEQVCRDATAGSSAPLGLCDLQARPNTSFVACNTAPCPARWEVSEFSACASPCSGLRQRTVECVSDRDGGRLVVAESSCPGSRPLSARPCTARHCPAWYTGSWSGCSTPCGPGVQSRAVECRNTSGDPSPARHCGGARPPDTKACSGPCGGTSAPAAGAQGGWHRLEDGNNTVKLEEDFKEMNVDKAVDHTVDVKEETRDESMHTQVTSNPNFTPAVRKVFGCGWIYVSFIADQWSPCSASCGEGIRFRKVQCKIFLEFSKTVASLPDKECPGLKPPETEICVDRPSCGSGRDVLADTVSIVRDTLHRGVEGPEMLPLLAEEAEQEPKYEWKIAGFTTCTASCLGGLQESIVICVESRRESPVAPYFCDPHKRLEIEVRTCNENPCPPRWNVSDFSDCSKSCGGGTQARSVQCIQEVAHGGNNIISLGPGSCPQPPPRAHQFCSVIDCPVQWQASPWTKCSRRCSGGSKYRKVRCQQLLSLGQMIDKPEGLCGGERPGMEEPCNLQECVYSDTPEIRSNLDQDYMQTDPYLKVLKLKVGGRATVYVGTTLKVRCPVKHYDKAQITWARGSMMFHSGRKRARHSKVSVSGKGGLKIKTIGFEDSGVYTCMASKSRAKLEVFVKDIEAHLTTTEVSPPDRSKKLWLNSVEGQMAGGGGRGRDLKLGQDKYSKSKATSHGSNTLGQDRFPFDEKPVKREKWNMHREDELMDDFVYWDTISGHVDDQARPADRQTEDFSQITGGACTASASVLLVGAIASILVIQVLTFVPWEGREAGKDEDRKRKRRKNKRKQKKGRKSSASEHALTWSPGPWSLCSRTCGGGEQRRRLACTMRLTERNVSQEVPTSFCRQAGLRRPGRVRACAEQDCPAWRRSPWAPCQRAECIARDTGLRTRAVHCIQDSRVVGAELCAASDRPADSQPCRNLECSGIWVLGEWSQCTVTCAGGTKARSVSCEWLAGGLAPAAECGEEARPASAIQCFGPPCRELWPEPRIVVSASRDGREAATCQDSSKFCGLIRTYRMCREEKFREQCCQTCRRL